MSKYQTVGEGHAFLPADFPLLDPAFEPPTARLRSATLYTSSLLDRQSTAARGADFDTDANNSYCLLNDLISLVRHGESDPLWLEAAWIMYHQFRMTALTALEALNECDQLISDAGV